MIKISHSRSNSRKNRSRNMHFTMHNKEKKKELMTYQWIRIGLLASALNASIHIRCGIIMFFFPSIYLLSPLLSFAMIKLRWIPIDMNGVFRKMTSSDKSKSIDMLCCEAIVMIYVLKLQLYEPYKIHTCIQYSYWNWFVFVFLFDYSALILSQAFLLAIN